MPIPNHVYRVYYLVQGTYPILSLATALGHVTFLRVEAFLQPRTLLLHFLQDFSP